MKLEMAEEACARMATSHISLTNTCGWRVVVCLKWKVFDDSDQRWRQTATSVGLVAEWICSRVVHGGMCVIEYTLCE